MKHNIILILLVLSFLIIPVNAAPPFIEPEISTFSLQVESPNLPISKMGIERRFHAHVINSSSTKTNLTTTCALHVYNQSGYDLELGSQWMEFEDYNGIDFAKTVGGGNFSKLGFYSYVIHCNSSNEVGFYRGQFIITPSGHDQVGDNFLIFFYILFTVVVCTLIYFLVINLAKLATSTTTVIDVAMSWSVFFIVLITYWLATVYVPEITFTNFMTSMLTGVALAFLYVVMPLISLIITMNYKSLEKKGNLSVEEMLGRKILHG